MICVLIVLVSAIFFIMLAIWAIELPCNSQFIKFKSFLSFYNINPNRWSLEDGYVHFFTSGYYPFGSGICYKFNFIDYYRYLWWHKRQKKREKLKKEMDNVNKMIQIIKKDIAKLEEENQANMQSAAKNIRDITSRM